MKLLITGFDAFGEDKINPSYEAVKLLPNKIKGIEIYKRELPTKYFKSIKLLDKYIHSIKPDFVICVGQAAGRNKISLERIGLNLMDATIVDNDGFMPKDIPIYDDGETAYFSNLPLKDILQYLKENNVSSEISYSAGTFVCNTSLYHLLYLINKQNLDFKAGFIHIPLINEQLKARDKTVFAMELSEIVEALVLAIASLSDNSVIM